MDDNDETGHTLKYLFQGVWVIVAKVFFYKQKLSFNSVHN